jgi:hypothetical protein
MLRIKKLGVKEFGAILALSATLAGVVPEAAALPALGDSVRLAPAAPVVAAHCYCRVRHHYPRVRHWRRHRHYVYDPGGAAAASLALGIIGAVTQPSYSYDYYYYPSDYYYSPYSYGYPVYGAWGGYGYRRRFGGYGHGGFGNHFGGFHHGGFHHGGFGHGGFVHGGHGGQFHHR